MSNEGAAKPPQHHAWLALICPAPFAPLFALLIPPFAIAALWDELRIRRHYRRAGRLLDWPEARDRLTAGHGTLIVEQMPKGGLGRAWWVEPDLVTEHPDAPLVSTAMHRPGADRADHFRQDFERLYSQSAHEWCERHLPALATRVHLVHTPRRLWRQCNDALSCRNVVLVYFDETYCFRSRRH